MKSLVKIAQHPTREWVRWECQQCGQRGAWLSSVVAVERLIARHKCPRL